MHRLLRTLAGAGLVPALVLAATLSCRGPGPDGTPEPSTSRTAIRHVVVITIDTLRADTLGFAGHREVATPTIDRLAAAGRIFTNAHAHNVVTLPSHANILTGLYPYQHGIRDNSGFVLPETVPTMASLLAAAGFATAAVVGAFPLDARFGLDRGFDLYDDRYGERSDPTRFVIAERPGDAVVEAALAWWRGQAGRRRFLWVHLFDPHAPYAPPEPFASRYRHAPYLGEIAAVDAYLEPLLQPFLDGQEEPALIVLTSDHGEALGDHGEVTHGLFAYEATLKVPLVVWGAGVGTGIDERPVGHVDLLPTVLDAVGLPRPEELVGRSLLAPVDHGSEGRGLYFEALSTYLNRGWAPLRGILRDGGKFIELPLPELYDLRRDPTEERNLVEEDEGWARALRQALGKAPEVLPERDAVSSEEAAMLRSLGYLTGSATPRRQFTPADDPKNLTDLDRKLHQLIDAYQRGDLRLAEERARELVAARPDMPLATIHLGLVLRQQERIEEAVAVLRSALERGVETPAIVRDLGLSLAEAGRVAEAIPILESVADDRDPESLAVLGAAYSDAGRQAQAQRTLERVLAADPEYARAHENLGVVLLRQGQPAAARDALRRALALGERRPIAWNTLGVALYQLGQSEEALDAWERAVELDPRQYDALYNLGITAASLGRSDEARRALRLYVARAPQSRFAEDIRKARALLAQLEGR
ncbi:MAG: sulfatase-like hydrolase/transferase [bacterium]|nr:sulfatase-like hydrolase/transferase [bacterium]